VHSVECTLHAYAEKPLHLHVRESVVFRIYTKTNRGEMEVNDQQSGTDTYSANFCVEDHMDQPTR
jgi:hypothetical protein